MTYNPPGNGGSQVGLILGANHRLGHALCQQLFADGGRLVIADADPANGAAICQRLGWQGTVASYRYLSPEQAGGEAALMADIRAVYGRLDLVVDFYQPACRTTRWLALNASQVRKLLNAHLQQQFRLLKATRALLQCSANPRLVQVCMGGSSTASSAISQMWQQLLADNWQRDGVALLRMLTDVQYGLWDTINLSSIDRDLDRLLALLDGSGPTAQNDE